MFINSNDIFNQIGLAVDPLRKSNYNTKPKYRICLEIQLSQNEKHILQVKDYDDPNKKATEFCQKHKLNRLAIDIVQSKIRQAMEIQQQKIIKYQKKKASISQKQKLDSTSRSKSQKNINNNKTPNKFSKGGDQSPNKNQNNGQSKSKSKSKTKFNKNDPTGNIYLRGLVKSRMVQQNRTKMKAQMQKKQQQHLTFKPKINNVSEKIVQFLKTNNIPKIKKPSPTKQMYDEMRQCTFKPKLNKVSERIYVNKTLIKEERQNHENLYEQQKNKIKKQKVVQQYTFKPQINPKSAQKINIPFFKRLQINEQKRNQVLNKKTFYNDQQCSFHPKINRGPLHQDRNKQNMNVWDHLYYGSKKDMEQNQQNQSTSEVVKQTASANQKYYENLIDDRIRNVFSTLDSDRDGLISPNLIAIQVLPVQCLQFLKPVFIEMDQFNATLNFYQFKKAVLALMSESDPGSKGGFIAAKWKKQLQQNNSYKPNINTRSKQMVVNRSVQHLYRDGLKQKQTRQYKLQKQRALKQQKQLTQCSFKPALSYSSKLYIQKISKRSEKEIKESKSISQLLKSHIQSKEYNEDQ